MSDLVSVIVPVYNVEKHLAECIKSILEQSYENIELILVNDGSPDSSGEICDSFAKTDSRVKVLHIENQGVANARNQGINIANGEYLVFVDSDDILERTFIETAYSKIIADNSDYVCGAFLKLEDGKATSVVDYLNDKGSPISIQTYLERMCEYQAGAFWGANWAKLFKKDIIDKNNITFESNILFAEDFRFNLEYLNHVKQISLIHEPVYYYRIDTTQSLSKKRRDPYKFWEEYRELYVRYKKVYKSASIYEKCADGLYRFLLNMPQEVLRTAIRKNNAKWIELNKIAKHISSDSDFCEAEKKLSSKSHRLSFPLYRSVFLLKMYLLEFRLFLKKQLKFLK